MITRIEALGYRCLRSISQPLDPFHVLVGPNASGKTTFLDVIAFLGRLVSDGPDAAIEERTQNFYDLLWRGEGTKFELAIEARIPPELRELVVGKALFDTVRYEVVLAIDPKTQDRGLQAERVLLMEAASSARQPRAVFPRVDQIPNDLKRKVNLSYIVHKPSGGAATIFPETPLGPLRNQAFNPGSRRSVLGNLPVDESNLFPVSFWLKEMLTSGVQQLVMNSLLLRKASPPGQGRGLRSDGSNLSWVVADLRKRSPERFLQWIEHLKVAFPDLEGVKTFERPEDRHLYLILQYRGGLEVPSWMASDGTLRMLALTLPAYLEDFKGIYLIEEPENGIHPKAIETMTQSLSSVYDGQVLMATHSPVVLRGCL